MKLITRDTDYAVRALCLMAKKKKVASVTELVKALKVPRPFLRKTLQILGKKNVVHSARGIGGGFSLARAPARIGVIEIIEIFQGPFHLNECFLQKDICPQQRQCKLKAKIDTIERYVFRQLRTITIESLLR